MSNLQLALLRPVGGFRMELRSDSIWGLFCWGLRLLYGPQKLADFFRECEAGNPPLLFSSAFPWKQYGNKADERLLFFPMPNLPAYLPTDETDPLLAHQLRKKLKAVQWLEFEDYKKALHGQLTAKTIYERILEEHRLESDDEQKAQLAQLKAHREAPRMETVSYTHNTIDRINLSTLTKTRDGSNEPEAGQLFHADETFVVDAYNETKDPRNNGLFFLVQGDWMPELEAVLRYFRINGWGGDRSSGKGTFDFELQAAPNFQRPANANAMTNLSLYFPTDDECRRYETEPDERLFSYRLQRRQGRIGFWHTDSRKPATMFFQEGSVFPLLEQTGYGRGCMAQKARQYEYNVCGASILLPMFIPGQTITNNP